MSDMVDENSKITETRWHWGWSVKPPDVTGAPTLRMELGLSLLSMSIQGFDAMPDDMMIGFWLSDNFDGAPEDWPECVAWMRRSGRTLDGVTHDGMPGERT